MKKLPILLSASVLLMASAGAASAHGPFVHHHPGPVYRIHKSPTPAQVAYHRANANDDTIHLHMVIK